MDKKKSSGAGQFLLKLPQTEWNGIYSIRNAIDSIRIFGPDHQSPETISVEGLVNRQSFGGN